MATDKSATMLPRNTHKIDVVLVYAFLEWILIFMLLLNSLLSYLISKFVINFGLKSPCIFCSRLDPIVHPIKNNNSDIDLICKKYIHEVSQLSYCPNHQNPLAELNGKEKKEIDYLETKYSSCSDEENESYEEKSTESQIYDHNNGFTVHSVVDEVEDKPTIEVFEKMEIDELVTSIIMTMQDIVGVANKKAQSPCTDSNVVIVGASNELQEVEDDDSEKLGQSSQEMNRTGTSNTPDISAGDNMDLDLNKVEGRMASEKLCETWNYDAGSKIIRMEIGDDAMTIEKFKMELKATQEALNDLYMELEEERNASTIAANQTLTMMTRLQQEKAHIKMEAQQYQRVMEEQSQYDQEALQLLNDLVVKKEKEKQELEKELQNYKKMFTDYEDREKFSKIQEVNDNDDFCAYIELDLEEIGIESVNNSSFVDESLGEFEVERLSILEELKALEMKLITLTNDDEQSFEDINWSGNHTNCPQRKDTFGSLSPEKNGMIVNVVSRKLDFDETEISSKEKIESSSSNKIKYLDFKFNMVNNRVTIEEEMSHVYDRIQGLEIDRDFLKHCIGSLSKGDEGIDLLKEILQHLRDLRTVEVRSRSLCGSPIS